VSDDCSALVGACVGLGLPQSVSKKLCSEVRVLAREGIPVDVIEEALRDWDARPGLSPAMLPHLVSDVVRRQKARVFEEKHVAWLRGWEARLAQEMSPHA